MMKKKNVAGLAAIVAAGLMIPTALAQISLTEIGRYETGIFAESGAEIAAYDAGSQRVFVTNAFNNAVDVLDLSDPTNPTLLFSIDMSAYGGGVNSVVAWDGLVAAAVEANDKVDPGTVAFFDTAGNFLSAVTAGALPDMITVTPDRKAVLVANEGEPDDDYIIDPVGSVSIIDVTGNIVDLTDDDVTTLDFTAYNNRDIPRGARIFGPNATVAQDLEPEYIAVDPDSEYAYVSLQENNAMAKIDIANRRIVGVRGLGFKNHISYGNGLDASNDDGQIRIARWTVRGMYQPDALATYKWKNKVFVLSANEGDARDYDGYSEEARVKDLVLDPDYFAFADELQKDENLGRLKTTMATGDVDNDDQHEAIFAYGARSFSIWSEQGPQIFDSGNDFEFILAQRYPNDFNSDNEENDSFDNRSDDKGPEPEALTIGEIDGRAYAFIGLERMGGIMIYDITNPYQVSFVDYWTNRDFSGDPQNGTAGDLGPEGIVFVPAAHSPNGNPLLIVSNEVSGTTTILEIGN